MRQLQLRGRSRPRTRQSRCRIDSYRQVWAAVLRFPEPGIGHYARLLSLQRRIDVSDWFGFLRLAHTLARAFSLFICSRSRSRRLRISHANNTPALLIVDLQDTYPKSNTAHKKRRQSRSVPWLKVWGGLLTFGLQSIILRFPPGLSCPNLRPCQPRSSLEFGHPEREIG